MDNAKNVYWSMTEIPYVYLLCIPEYSGVRHWADNYAGCGTRIGEQSGRIYTYVINVTDWAEEWFAQHQLEFLK